MTIDARELLEGTTPGPWEWRFKGRDDTEMGSFVGADDKKVCDFGDCETYYPTQGDPPSPVDAALIAAAPALARDNIAKDAVIEAQSTTIERIEAERDRLRECAMLYREQWLDGNEDISGKREPCMGESDPLATKGATK